MLQTLRKRLRAEIALHRHNRRNRRGMVDADAQAFHVLHDVLPEPVFQRLQGAVADAQWVRSATSWRDGEAVGGHELAASPLAPALAYLDSAAFIAAVRARCGLSALEFVPRADTNRLSLLRYAEDDGIDWHVDGSIYLGPRWAGILTLIERTGDDTAKLELNPHGRLATLPAKTAANSLVLFRGDHVQHRVRPMAPGEERVVLSLLFSTWPVRTMNPWLLRYQSRVNRTFYGNARL